MEAAFDAGVVAGETVELSGQVRVVEDVPVGLGGGGEFRFHAADAAEIPVRVSGDGPISALSWDATGARLLFGLESGAAGLLALPA